MGAALTHRFFVANKGGHGTITNPPPSVDTDQNLLRVFSPSKRPLARTNFTTVIFPPAHGNPAGIYNAHRQSTATPHGPLTWLVWPDQTKPNPCLLVGLCPIVTHTPPVRLRVRLRADIPLPCPALIRLFCRLTLSGRAGLVGWRAGGLGGLGGVCVVHLSGGCDSLGGAGWLVRAGVCPIATATLKGCLGGVLLVLLDGWMKGRCWGRLR